MTQKNKFAAAIKQNAPKSIQPTPDTTVTPQTDDSVAVTSDVKNSAQEWKTPRTRKGRRAITSYVSTDAHKQLKLLAIEQDKTIKELMDEAVEALFREYGKTPLN